MLDFTPQNEPSIEPTPETTAELNLEDLVWLREKSFALRNVKKSMGLKEVSQGGTGDAYSLAYYFNPKEAIISETDPEEIALRRTLLGPFCVMWDLQDKDLFPGSCDHEHASLISDTLLINLQRFLSSEKCQKSLPEKIKQALTLRMKNNLLQILENCLKQPKDKEPNFFEIMERQEAQFPRELSNKIVYPTVKCGTAPFTATQIKATFEEKPHGSHADSHQMYSTLSYEVKRLRGSLK